MSIFMVLGMEFYNGSLQLGEWTRAVFPIMLGEMRFMVPLCFVSSFFVMDKLAQKLAFRLVTPGKDLPILVTLVRSGITVSLMCPTMSLWATLIFHGISGDFVNQWLGTVIRNFPMAFFWQIFYCGPLVRFLFRRLFLVRAEKNSIILWREKRCAAGILAARLFLWGMFKRCLRLCGSH